MNYYTVRHFYTKNNSRVSLPVLKYNYSMIQRISLDKLTWVNLKNPTTSEIQEVLIEFAVPPALMSDFNSTVPKNSACTADGFIKLVLDFPVVKQIDIKHPYEVKFLLSSHVLVTAHYEEMEAIDKFTKQLEVITTLRRASTRTSGAHLFFALLDELYGACSTKLDYVESLLAEIEADIFLENEKVMVERIANVSKKLISFRHILKTHEEILRDAAPLFKTVFKTIFTDELSSTHTDYTDLIRRTDMLYTTLKDLRETNLAMLTTKQNEIMKILTIMAFITFPLSLFTSMFGMNTESTPLLGRPGDFWIIVGIMSVVTIGFFGFFKYKRWM